MNRRAPALLILFSLTLFPTARQAAAQVGDGRGAAAPQITTSRARRIDSVFATFDNTRSPGCAAGVLANSELAFARGYGMASLDHGISITPETIFRTGSVSKQFTAAVVVLLAREGAFTLDDDIRLHFPEIPAYQAPITIRHLLHHTSGLRDYLELMAMRGVGDEATYGEEDVVELLSKQKALNFAPGSEFRYSNSGYLLLSRLVERTTGETLREQAQRLIFGPLGMEATHFHDNHREVVPRRATGYGLGPEGGFGIDQTTLDIVGDGGVFTSIQELQHWMRNYWTLEVGGAEWLSTMETRGVLSSGDTLSYALGLGHGVQRGIPFVGHGGSFVGYKAATLRYPGENVGVMVLCNFGRVDPMGLALQVGEAVLEDRMGPPPSDPPQQERTRPDPGPTLSPEAVSEYLGEFYSEEVGAVFRILQTEEGLTVDVNGARDFPMYPVGEDAFRAGFLNLRFGRRDGAVSRISVGSGRAGGVVFTRR
jgi:CubicO group peptidase (beta-lactamase class C family)